MKKILLLFIVATIFSCQEKLTNEVSEVKKEEFVWEGANIYFLLTDRFNNGDPSNDINNPGTFYHTENYEVLKEEILKG